MIFPIVAYGDSVLKKEAEEIDKDFPDLKKLIEDMYETMYSAQGVGLAAPQIGKSIRLFIVDGSPFADDEDEDEEPDPRAVGMEDFKKVFINPIIEEEEGEEWGFHEGCLSIPKIREEVFRKEKVHISYFNENWEFKEEVYDGYAAGTSMRCWVEAEDIANMALFLGSDASRWVSGQVIAVDGHTENPDPKV